jgi:fructokinase
MPHNVLAFGELLWDLLPSGEVLGGAPANFACRMHELGHITVLVTRLGRDSRGKAAFEQVRGLGLSTDLMQWDDKLPTGTVQVTLDEKGNPDFEIVPRVAYDQIEPTDALLKAAATVQCLCFGTLVQRAAQSRATLQRVVEATPRSALKVFDINLRKDCYSSETVNESLARANMLKLNENEVDYLSSQFGLPRQPLAAFAEAAVERWDLSHCLVTLGERGAFAVGPGGERRYSPGFRVALADTCGSGDACTAGFVHHLLAGEPLVRCLEFGNALGAMVAGQRGATEPISSTQLQAMLQNPPARIVDESLM